MVTRYLVDTSVWVNILRGDPKTRERMDVLSNQGASLLMCEPVAMELLAGARKHEVFAIKEFIDSFASLEFDALHDFRSAGEIRRQLSWQGRSVRSVVDCMIAVLALTNEEIVIVHNDADFDMIAGAFNIRHERWEQGA
jgi:predicted nucleic acid-binding protein